jgi:hypothetical protein
VVNRAFVVVCRRSRKHVFEGGAKLGRRVKERVLAHPNSCSVYDVVRL